MKRILFFLLVISCNALAQSDSSDAISSLVNSLRYLTKPVPFMRNLSFLPDSGADRQLPFIKFDDNLKIPIGTNSIGRVIMQINPVIKHPHSVPFVFSTSSTNYGNWQEDNVFLHGYNLSWGGGAIVQGEPGIGYSMEQNYKPTADASLTESHEFWITKEGKQIRLKSYTINNNTNDVDFYHTVSRFKIKVPFTEDEYFRVSSSAGLKGTQLILKGQDAAIILDRTVLQSVASWNALTVNTGTYLMGRDTWGTGLYVSGNTKIDGNIKVQDVDLLREIKALKARIAILEAK